MGGGLGLGGSESCMIAVAGDDARRLPPIMSQSHTPVREASEGFLAMATTATELPRREDL